MTGFSAGPVGGRRARPWRLAPYFATLVLSLAGLMVHIGDALPETMRDVAMAADTSCNPRPTIGVSVVRHDADRLRVTLNAGTSASVPFNRLQELWFPSQAV